MHCGMVRPDIRGIVFGGDLSGIGGWVAAAVQRWENWRDFSIYG